jgi:Domain of unknown function (DUF2431).
MKRGLRVLTVGDGDLSCSLALKRAYPELIEHLVVTTLLSSKDELLNIYPHSRETIANRSNFESIQIIYGIDATKLHLYRCFDGMKFDIVLFHHPHLGYVHEHLDFPSDVPAQNIVASQHSQLLAHYLYSAMKLTSCLQKELVYEGNENLPLPCIHLCLCRGAIDKWDLKETVVRLNLEYTWNSPFPASSPPFSFYEALFSTNDGNCNNLKTSTHLLSTQRRRKGTRKGHWLGKFGYRHQPTDPHHTHFKTNVSNSYHIFLRFKASALQDFEKRFLEESSSNRCLVCNSHFGNRKEFNDLCMSLSISDGSCL